MNYGLLLIPLLTAFTGWLVIRLVITLLFHPRQPKRILGFTIQGALPRQQTKMAGQIGEIAAGFISIDALQEKITGPESMARILPMIEAHIDDFLRHRLGKEMPMISMFIGDKTIAKMKAALMKEIENLFPQVMNQFTGNLKEQLDIKKLVTQKIEAIPPTQLEGMLKKSMGGQVNKLQWLGVLTGLLVGLVQLALLLFLA